MSIKKELIRIPGQRIKQARIEAGLSQPDLAELIGKKRTWISFRENEKRPLYQNDLEKIARATHKPISWFFKGEDAEIENLQWKAQQYDCLMQQMTQIIPRERRKHYTEMSDEEIDRELERFGINDPEFKALIRAIPVLKEKEKEKILQIFSFSPNFKISG